MDIADLNKAAQSLAQLQSFQVEHLRMIRREGDDPDTGTGPWQVRFTDGAFLSCETENDARILQSKLSSAIRKVVEPYQQTLKRRLLNDTRGSQPSATLVCSLVKWISDMNPDPVHVQMGTNEHVVGLDAGWVIYVDELEKDVALLLKRELQQAISSVMKGLENRAIRQIQEILT